jgi:hypothetical protein
MADRGVLEPGRPVPREPEPRRRSRASPRILKQVDLGEAIRLTGGVGTSLATGSRWWFIAAAIYSIAAKPTQDFLRDLQRRVGPALGDRIADRISNGPRRHDVRSSTHRAAMKVERRR